MHSQHGTFPPFHIYPKAVQWSREDNNARNCTGGKGAEKAKTKMGERHHRYVRQDGSSKQSGGGQASISQTHLGSDVLTRICSEKKFEIKNQLAVSNM